MLSYWIYVLIGNNDTGKTSFQKHLVEYLCDRRYDRLPRNIVLDVTHLRAPRQFRTLFTANRSYQEKRDEYESVERYMNEFLTRADVTILSSHSHPPSSDDLQEMIEQAHRQHYNIAAVFFSNGEDAHYPAISELDWDERLWIDNPLIEDQDLIDQRGAAIQCQLKGLAIRFGDMLIARTALQ